jgi:hypothetical protein
LLEAPKEMGELVRHLALMIVEQPPQSAPNRRIPAMLVHRPSRFLDIHLQSLHVG